MFAKYRLSKDAYESILDALHIRGKKAIKYATMKDIINYINLNFGLRYKITSLVISG